MKKLFNYRYEMLATGLFSLLCAQVLRIVRTPPGSSFGRFLAFAAVMGNFFALLWTLKRLWRKKWRRAFLNKLTQLAESAFEFISRLFDGILKRLGVGEKKNILGGKTSVIFDGTDDIGEKKKKKRKKWRQLESDRERLGYLYSHMIIQRLGRGIRAKRSDTPSELKNREENSPAEEELFEMYIDVRYSEKEAPPTEELQRMRERLGQ